MNHNSLCLCEVCALQQAQNLTYDEAIALSNQHDAELIAKVGWVAHALTDAPLIHTHGLLEHFDHLDLEIRLAVSPQQRYDLLAPLAEAVKAGCRFTTSEEDTTVFSVPIRFVIRCESGRSVLRAIFPDPEGRFPGDPGWLSAWADQLVQD